MSVHWLGLAQGEGACAEAKATAARTAIAILYILGDDCMNTHKGVGSHGKVSGEHSSSDVRVVSQGRTNTEKHVAHPQTPSMRTRGRMSSFSMIHYDC